MQPKEFRELREAAGLSQTALAPLIGLTKQTLSHMECGRRSIDIRTGLALRYIVEQIKNNA